MASPVVSPLPSPTPEAATRVLPPRPSPAAATYAFPVQGCRADYGADHHDYPATDVFAGTGCAVVAMTAGTVDEVSVRDDWTPQADAGATRGGLSVSVVGDDGVRYYVSHLSRTDSGVVPGARVRTGQRLGEVGRTGSARPTPPHVHVGLSWPTGPDVWWVRRGVVSPAPYLDAWRAGRQLSPAAAVASERARQGEVPPCRRRC